MNLLDYLWTPDTLVHIANIFLLISFSAKSMLILRGLNIIAGGFFIAYFLMLPDPLWASGGMECSLRRRQSMAYLVSHS